MTDGKPPRGRPQPRPKGFDDVPELSDEEVERRVGVRGGTVPRAPIERPARVARAPLRAERRTARDSLLLVGLVVVGLVAVRLFLPEGPLTVSSTNTPNGTDTAVATSGPTAGTQTLVPVMTLPPGSTEPSQSGEPTVEPTAPGPTPTLKPGATPRPTLKPKPTAAPGSTPSTTPSPTTPGAPTILVKMHVVNDNGGNAPASAWTMKVTGEVGSSVSPNNFPGSEAGTLVTITADKGYLVSDNTAVAGYSVSASDGCRRYPGSGLTAGDSVECVITRNDIAPRLSVTIAISGGTPSPNPVVVVTPDTVRASPSSISTIGTTVVTLDANESFQVEESVTPTGYIVDKSGTCSSSGLALNTTMSCTYTYTYTAPAPTPSALVYLLPLVLPRRWRTTAAG